MTLQRRQFFNTIMQIICPIFGLACVSILRAAVMANADIIANINIVVPIPFIYNIPMKPLSNFENIIFNVSDCNEWYMYKFEDEATKEDREFFGSNEGKPMLSPVSSGLLASGQSILATPCKEINRTVPYFEEQDNFGRQEYNESLNEFVDRHFNYLA